MAEMRKDPKMQIFRHGDVILVEVDAIPETAKREQREGDILLALGEVTGHAHRIATPGAVTFLDRDQRYLRVGDKGAALTHEEHARIDLPAGNYRITIQRVYVPGALPERVVD